jgi:hypothetical protein
MPLSTSGGAGDRELTYGKGRVHPTTNLLQLTLEIVPWVPSVSSVFHK